MKQIHIRILLSILVFIGYIFATIAGLIFPLGFIVVLGLVGVITSPFIKLLQLGDTDIDYLESFIELDIFKPKSFRESIVNNLLSVLLPIWLPFFGTYRYIKTGKLLK